MSLSKVKRVADMNEGLSSCHVGWQFGRKGM